MSGGGDGDDPVRGNWRTPTRDPWADLARLTPARIALGRTGASLPTREVLAFALAHGRARDAVHAPLDTGRLDAGIRTLGFATVQVASAAATREIYLRRPDLGRTLAPEGRAALVSAASGPADLALVVADGLSATAVHAQAIALIAAFRPWIAKQGWSTAPVVIATQARVALGDEVGALLQVRVCAMLIGERPGLSSPDSLGIYLTAGPRVGRTDAERNCISNVRAEGLSPEVAAFKLAFLMRAALARGVTGVALKDESDTLLVEGRPPPRLPAP